MRQFMLRKQQEHASAQLSVRDNELAADWEKLPGGISGSNKDDILYIQHLLMAELACNTARHFWLGLLEQELQEELVKEKHLSQQFSRKVILEPSDVCVSQMPSSRGGCTNLPPIPAQQAAVSFCWHSHNQWSTLCRAL